MVSVEQLIQVAQDVRARAYAPYSGYLVGAAIETDAGEIVAGCNVENLSHGATICAERTAVTGMVAAGTGKRIVRVVVCSEDGVTPCGICLQVLQEFVQSGDVPVICIDSSGRRQEFKFRELLPHAFFSEKVRRTDPTQS